MQAEVFVNMFASVSIESQQSAMRDKFVESTCLQPVNGFTSIEQVLRGVTPTTTADMNALEGGGV